MSTVAPVKNSRAIIDHDAGTIALITQYKLRELCKSIPGYVWNSHKKCWQYPATQIAARHIIEQFSSRLDEKSLDALMLFAIDALSKDVTEDDLKQAIDLEQPPKRTGDLWLHQLQAYHWGINKRALMLAFKMGWGKTKTAITVAHNRDSRLILVICPLAVVAVWPAEFLEHAPGEYIVCDLSKGSVADKTKRAKQALAHKQPTTIVINFESAWRDPFATFAKAIVWDEVIVDESHRIKKPGGKASNFCKEVGKRAGYRQALTGTPMAQSPLDVYGQFRFLDSSIFGLSYNRFKNRYAIENPNIRGAVVGYKNEDELSKLFYTIAFRADDDTHGKDVLDIPEPLPPMMRYCELTPRAQKIYQQVESMLFAMIDDKVVTASNALVKLLRLQQITSGYVPVDEVDPFGEQQLEYIDDSKAKLLKEILIDLGNEPVVIFCRFRHDIDQVRAVCTDKEVGRTPAELSGGHDERDQFYAGEANTMVVQEQSGSLGVSFVQARVCIYYSKGFSLSTHEQSKARLHRPGQTRSVLYIHLLARGTVDEKVARALADRKNVIEAVLGIETNNDQRGDNDGA